MLKGIHSSVIHKRLEINLIAKKRINYGRFIKFYAASKMTFYKEILIKVTTTITTANPYIGQALS